MISRLLKTKALPYPFLSSKDTEITRAINGYGSVIAKYALTLPAVTLVGLGPAEG